MHFHLLTIFPDFFVSPLTVSLVKKAQEKGIVSFTVHNLRDYATGAHKATDDSPYGGGQGMVMKPEPIINALEQICAPLARPWRILLSPQGIPLSQEKVKTLATKETLVLVCGRYEGVDERVRAFVDEEISIGDYILNGGETAALVIVDAVSRLVPGFVGRKESTEEESFSDGLLEYPHYTRPEEFRNMHVPEVLLSGNHAEITTWRRRQALRRTRKRRPDLLSQARLSAEEQRWLAQESNED
jgi:tRNA (guanine37-N1)-methyltransferase